MPFFWYRLWSEVLPLWHDQPAVFEIATVCLNARAHECASFRWRRRSYRFWLSWCFHLQFPFERLQSRCTQGRHLLQLDVPHSPRKTEVQALLALQGVLQVKLLCRYTGTKREWTWWARPVNFNLEKSMMSFCKWCLRLKKLDKPIKILISIYSLPFSKSNHSVAVG